MSDRKIADTVNKLKQIAIDFHDHQSLRERIRSEVLALVKELKAELSEAIEIIEHSGVDYDEVREAINNE